jgi:hypothetical protein
MRRVARDLCLPNGPCLGSFDGMKSASILIFFADRPQILSISRLMDESTAENALTEPGHGFADLQESTNDPTHARSTFCG